MKTVVQAASLFLLLLLVIVFMINFFGDTTSTAELESSLDNAMEHALYVAISKNNYTIENHEQLAADVLHELMGSCNIEADYTIEFRVIDHETGLLDVCVTQDCRTSSVLHSKISCHKTLIFETTT